MTDGVERPCSLCDEPAADRVDVENEDTGEVRTGWFCEGHLDKLERYNRGEEVDWYV